LSGEVGNEDPTPTLRVGSAVISLDHLPTSGFRGSAVWAAAPREAFKLLHESKDGPDILKGHVVDVRFAASTYLVDVKGPSFSVEVAVNGGDVPSVGNPVTVSINPNHLRLFPKEPHAPIGSGELPG
jgi:hypothetical protein